MPSKWGIIVARDRNDAQAFVLVTSQRTGSSGQEFTLTFIGKQEFKDINVYWLQIVKHFLRNIYRDEFAYAQAAIDSRVAQ